MCFFSFLWLSDCAPPTCYSRALGLSKEVMALLDKIHSFHRTVSTGAALAASAHQSVFTISDSVSCLLMMRFVWFQKTCAEILPTIFIDVHVSFKLGFHACHVEVLKEDFRGILEYFPSPFFSPLIPVGY